MRKTLTLCILLAFSLTSAAQKHKKNGVDDQAIKDSSVITSAQLSTDTLYLRMYHNGMKYGDYRTAIIALNALYAIHPSNIGYLDSLCLLYAQTENYAQCIFTGRELVKYMPDNISIISAMAVSEQQLGRYEEALDLFKKEYAKNSSLYASYQIAVLQYALKKYGEAQASLDRLILDPEAIKTKINFSASSNSTQPIIYRAAAENLMGIIYQELKDYPKANEHFKKALEIQPDFVLAQNNKESLKKLMEVDNKEVKSGKNASGTNKNNTKTK